MPFLLDLNEEPIPDLNEVPPATCPATRKRLTNLEKDQIVHILIFNYNNDKLGKGIIKQIASKYEVTWLVISQLWKATLQAIRGDEHPNVHRKYKGSNKSKVFNLENVSSISLHLRTNIRTLACQLNAPKSTVHIAIQKGEIKSHSNALKPYLTSQNMEARVRPRYDKDGVCIFDGKIGIFPFTIEEPAARASKNRARGVIEVKPIESITKIVIKQCLIEKIIPAIKVKWSSDFNKHIVIQQDNARPHISDNDEDFIKVAQDGEFYITLANQPPNSPDLNINDLGFFRIIQGLQHEKAPKTVTQLVYAVKQAYEEIGDSTKWLNAL
ncbi:hypothetical protein POM88_027791 [Heracleum sosnowskyi]|uniref:Transposase n=1 Tax=Heracleum sosnowskyi TaxID=360622 RepID=A0AAD8MPV4_9APIA|nr:hypothetical protein POM88_027790 [Heracleum sosnowskyi]KAK1381047.1 hypothetical protein POM88_027791 [Heracleum sosnowskyi]